MQTDGKLPLLAWYYYAMDNSSLDDKLENVLKAYFATGGKVRQQLSSMSGGALMLVHGGQKFVLKVFGEALVARRDVQFHSLLHDQGLPVPAIVANRNGKPITLHGGKSYVLYEFCEGREIGWGDDLASVPKQLAKSLADAVAALHNFMIDKEAIDAPRFHQALRVPEDLENGGLTVPYQNALAELKGLGLDDFATVAVHSDLTRENIFVSDDLSHITGIIDFGDAHYDFVVWDTAVLITQVFITKSWGIDWEGIGWFLEEYYRLFQLSHAEKASLVPLIKIRNVQLAIEAGVQSLSDKNEMLRSIQSSASTKLLTVEKNTDRLRRLFIPIG